MNAIIQSSHKNINDENANIVVRKNLDFRLSKEIDRHWYEQNPIATRIFDALSLSFPEGERYFIRSVRHFRDQIKDPDLKTRVVDFIWQEAQHGLAHDKINNKLHEQGMPTEQILTIHAKVLALLTKHLSPETNLALTAASEHITALMAETFYSYRSTMENADPNIRALLAWHAIEEMEHRDVAFDVMQNVANVAYPLRASALLSIHLITVPLICYYVTLLLKADGYSLTERLNLYRDGWVLVFGQNGLFKPMYKPLLSWFNPKFHPNKHPVIAQYPVWVETFAETSDPILAGEAFWAAGK